MINKKNKFIQLWLILGLFAGFILILFLVISYLNSQVICNLDCNDKNKVIASLITLSLGGIFVGSLTYYFISEKYEKKIFKIQKNLKQTLNFLETGPKKLLETIIENNGQITQSQLTQTSNLSKLQVSRYLKTLENKKIILKTKSGMTNNIKLNNELTKIYINK